MYILLITHIVFIINCLIFTSIVLILFFFFNDTATTEIYTLSLHDALPILDRSELFCLLTDSGLLQVNRELMDRSEEHTSELQSLAYLVCRLLLEKKKTNNLR